MHDMQQAIDAGGGVQQRVLETQETDHLDGFRKYLRGAGATIDDLCEPSTVLRYMLEGKVFTITVSPRTGSFHWPVAATRHFLAFQRSIAGPGEIMGTTPAGRAATRQFLLDRDGHHCSLCDGHLGGWDLTVEHWLPKLSFPFHHVDNLTLMHRRCNELLGSLSISRKIRVRDYVRQKLIEAGALGNVEASEPIITAMSRKPVATWQAAGVVQP